MLDVYAKLARHLQPLTMGYPMAPGLEELLRGSFTPEEAGVLLAVPNDLDPLSVVEAKEVARAGGLAEEEEAAVLHSLAKRRLIYSAPTPAGEPGYAVFQIGFGMPQSFFWDGGQDPRAQKAALLVANYFKPDITEAIYAGRKTKSYKYAPASLTVEAPMQGVAVGEMIQGVISGAELIALCHCPCRVTAKMLGRHECVHSVEVCFKYDEMARFVLDKGLAREVSADEALAIMKSSEEEGLVHMVDNVAGKAKHTCNCCGHWCWNVGIIRRRKIPRDRLMASYFIRATEEDACLGCGACAEVCPVQAVSMKGGLAVVDLDWCIGCGVCAVRCPAGCISIERRLEEKPPGDFAELNRRIRKERGLAPSSAG